MPADILTRIQNEIHAFSKGQKKIASYILTNYDKAAFMTASRLGKTVEVSAMSISPSAGTHSATRHMVRPSTRSIRRRPTCWYIWRRIGIRCSAIRWLAGCTV